MPPASAVVLRVFEECHRAVEKAVLIERAAHDKEFHFQNWFENRLAALRDKFDPPLRNTYPDFRMVQTPEGFETKGLEYPGRVVDFDCNSQVPCGLHNGRSIYYVFGRYPKTKESSFTVYDLVICHGNLLNAHHDYKHKNKSFRGFGSYGEILVRDRKMYVAPTPFGLLDGIERLVTLVLPADQTVDGKVFIEVGSFERVESEKVVSSYSFDMTTNALELKFIDNPHKGTRHAFKAYRVKGAVTNPVTLKQDLEQGSLIEEDPKS